MDKNGERLGKRLSSPIRSVFVASLRPGAASQPLRSGSEARRGCRDDHVTGAVVVQQCHRAGDSAVSIMSSKSRTQVRPATSPATRLDTAVGYPRITGLVDEGERHHLMRRPTSRRCVPGRSQETTTMLPSG